MKIKLPSWLRQPPPPEPFWLDLNFTCPCERRYRVEVREPKVRVVGDNSVAAIGWVVPDAS